MKKLFNIFMVLLAFALATTAFVSCSSDSDDDDSSSSANVVAEFARTTGTAASPKEESFTFYDNNTVKMTDDEGDVYGTWTGSLSSAGTMTLSDGTDSMTVSFSVSGNTLSVDWGSEEPATYTKK